MNAILDANRQYTEWTFDKQRRISELEGEIAGEKARPTLDPMALGVRYVEIETICREIGSRAAEVRTANVALLTDAQKAQVEGIGGCVEAVSDSQGSTIRPVAQWEHRWRGRWVFLRYRCSFDSCVHSPGALG